MATKRLLTGLLLTAAVTGQNEPTTELGTIAWQRDYDVANATARKANKPLLVLFQEVPG